MHARLKRPTCIASRCDARSPAARFRARCSSSPWRARELGRPLLRLDCEAARPRLRAIYERFGFSHHSDFSAGPYRVARYELRVG
jgi:hypothetical protein